MAKRVLIVGGVAGGASCAARLRRLDEKVEIVMFERGAHISFANCGLPYYVGGEIKKRDALLVQSVEKMKSWFNIDTYVQTEVVGIDAAKKIVTVTDFTTGESRNEPYDVLVLSPGAAPYVPALEGLEAAKDRLFTVRNVNDVDHLKGFIDAKKPQTAVIAGGGYIGLEMAENLVRLGIKVHLVQRPNQLMKSLDIEMTAPLVDELRAHGVEIHLSNALDGFENDGRTVHLKDGTVIDADFTILAIGVRPDSKLAKDAGFATTDRGAIIVDDQFRVAGADDVYAIGDAIQVKDYIFGKDTYVPLAGPANRMGRMVADIICGQDKHYKGTLSSSVCRVFDTTCAATGKNVRQLNEMGIGDYQCIHLYPANHATYYPGASQMCLKVIYAKADGKLYGAQAVGRGAGIEKTIDVIATAIRGNLSVYDLQDLELCYAPPFGTAKAPVNFAGYIAENIANGENYLTNMDALDALVADGAVLLDVRTDREIQKVPMPATHHIPINVLRDRIDELPKDQPIYITCMIGLRGHIACRMLQAHGYTAINVAGGAKLYHQFRHN